ncbi:MAG TPA: glucose-6-phosphate isomerase [Methylomirabilota bacterium]|nr:glucose-6-phosphate isomerase [Methylomirabilota bacterium]
MTFSKAELWQRFVRYYTAFPNLGLTLDISRVNFPEGYFKSMEPRMQAAYAAMRDLEAGAIANPDENRMVGHYWLRNPSLAPSHAIRHQIEGTLAEIKSFVAKVHDGTIRGAQGTFQELLLIGIGGSALGPQFVAHALGHPDRDKMRLHFFDNTDPDGMDKVLASLRGKLGRTLTLVVSKSGGTKETRNGMLEAKFAYESAGLAFEKHAVAITSIGSELDKLATGAAWTARFPMWDWVGGRTSETSAVGLLPAALQGIDIDELLRGARCCDEQTRSTVTAMNPAAQLALMWFYIGKGRGEKDMVILPYKDRLELLSKYLQQLIMESLGKEKDLHGHIVNQGIAVYGNKGSTDQHAYVQQLRDGVANFFVTFIQVLKDRDGRSVAVEEGVTSGDYLNGFYLGTRQALYENGRESISIAIDRVSPFSIGVLIALFERAVGFYASLISVNAYHQPGVEAGKKAAGNMISLQCAILKRLGTNEGRRFSVADLANAIGNEDLESVFKVCQHLVATRPMVEGDNLATPDKATVWLRR